MPSFNNNPSAYVDLNNYFPLLNEKVGLSDEQFRILVENTNYLLNHLGLADVNVGTVQTVYTEPGTHSDVVVTHREEEVDGHIIDYFDYVFSIPTPSIDTDATTVISEKSDEANVNVTPVPILDDTNAVIGYKFNFDFTIPRGMQGLKGVSIRNRGAFQETATYVNDDEYLDIVQYEGNLYAPNVDETTGNLPTNVSYFDLLVSRGARGNGITGIEKTGTEGLVDTYTIHTTDGDDYTFNVTNGAEQDITGKADKVDNAIEGNFAGLDANGNLKDSGNKASDFLTEHQDISNKEDNANKKSTIDNTNNTSETFYPCIKAVADYVDAKFGEMATLLSEV